MAGLGRPEFPRPPFRSQEQVTSCRNLEALGLLGLAAVGGGLAMAKRRASLSIRARQVLSRSDELSVGDRLRKTRPVKRVVELLSVEAPGYNEQGQVVTRLTTVSVSSQETQRKTYSDFTPEQWAEARRKRKEHFEQRQAKLDAARALTPGMGCYGASNWPGLPDYADWRENLPEDDPLRQIGPPLLVSGSPEHHAQISAAYNAFTKARQQKPQ